MGDRRDLTYFLRRLREFSFLTDIEGEGKSIMDSSLNQRHGPRDCNFFLRDEDDWHVLVDYKGPGVITRFSFTAVTATSTSPTARCIRC